MICGEKNGEFVEFFVVEIKVMKFEVLFNLWIEYVKMFYK